MSKKPDQDLQIHRRSDSLSPTVSPKLRDKDSNTFITKGTRSGGQELPGVIRDSFASGVTHEEDKKHENGETNGGHIEAQNTHVQNGNGNQSDAGNTHVQNGNGNQSDAGNTHVQNGNGNQNDAGITHIQNGKANEMARKPKISLSKIFKFKPMSISNRRAESLGTLPGKPADVLESLDNDVENGGDHLAKADEAKILDFGLYKPRNGDDENGREKPTQRKLSHENVTFHLGSDTESEAECAMSNGASSNESFITIENEAARQQGKENEDEDDTKPLNGRANTGVETRSPNSVYTGRGISRGSFTSRSSIVLSTPKNKARQTCDNIISEDDKTSENDNNNHHNNIESNNDLTGPETPETNGISLKRENSKTDIGENNNIITNDDNNINHNNNNNYDNNNSINSNDSRRSMNSIVQGILRKGSDRDLATTMSGGLRRYRRRSQMSITSEIPADVPPKQRRAECENRIRDNLDYFRRKVSVQEENNLVFDENGFNRPAFRKSVSIDDNGTKSEEAAMNVGYVASPQQLNHNGFKHSSSLGSISPMSLSPTSSTIFDYGTGTSYFPGRRSANGSISSVRWEDIVLAEGHSNGHSGNKRSDENARPGYNSNRVEEERECRNVKVLERNDGVVNNGFQRNDESERFDDDDDDDESGKMQTKRRHGSVSMPLNVIDLEREHADGDRARGLSNGFGARLYDGCDAVVVATAIGVVGGDSGVVVGGVDRGGDDGCGGGDDDGDDVDDPPPYVPMKRRQVERAVKTDWASFKSNDHNVPYDNFRRHSSASVDSAWSTGSAGSSASILRQDSLAIFNRKSSGPIRRLSQISMTDLGNIRRKHMEMTKTDMLKTYSLHIFVLFIFIVTVLSVSLAWYYRNLSMKMLQQTQRVFFDPRSRKLSLTDPTDHLTIEGYLGLDMPRWQLPLHCPLVVGQDPSKRSCEWKNNAVLTIDHFGNDQVECYNVTWKSKHPSHVPYDCFHLEGSEWYGPSNNTKGVWPIKGNFSYSPSNQRRDNNGIFSFVVDHYWLSSSGVGLRVHGEDPVHVNWNQTAVKNSLCLLSNYTGSLYDQTSPPMLKYTICNGMDAVKTHSFMLDTFPPKTDVTFPPDYVFSGFHWSAKGIMGRKRNVSQEDISNLTAEATKFTSRISSSVFPSSFSSSSLDNVKIVLDTYWQKEEGDLTFDLELFPNVTDMVYDLNETGSRLILSVSPQVYFNSESFHTGILSDLFVHDASGDVTGLIEYEEGVASVLDVTKKDVSHWLTEKLKVLMAPSVISSLRFSYGTHPWLPFKPHFGAPTATPDTQRQRVVEIISQQCDAPIVEHTGNTRHLPQLIPVPSRIRYDASSGRKCIRGTIETALTMGLMGYPFALADGLEDDTVNIIGPTEIPEIPDKELYIRWLQIASFFPAAQLTTAPWQYDAEVVAIATNLRVLHEMRVLPILRTPSLRQEVTNGMPLIRPVWWMDPSNRDFEKFQIDDEFIIGDSLLVAPVLCKEVRKRDVYIPSGVWEDIRLRKVIIGPNMLTNYPVPLHEIAVFKRRETVM